MGIVDESTFVSEPSESTSQYLECVVLNASCSSFHTFVPFEIAGNDLRLSDFEEIAAAGVDTLRILLTIAYWASFSPTIHTFRGSGVSWPSPRMGRTNGTERIDLHGAAGYIPHLN
jgi:hypothetical protein